MAKNVTTETDLTKIWQELGQKVKSQNKEISSLLQSMRQEREEMKQESEQGQQRLSSAVLRMELQLRQLQPKKLRKKTSEGLSVAL
jgi:hypothetical protein